MKYLLFVLLIFYVTNCQDYNSNSADESRFSEVDLPDGSSQQFINAYIVARNSCFECHSEWAAFTTEQDWIDSGRVVSGDPDSSSVINRLKNYSSDGDMPPSGPLSSEDYEALYDWVEGMTL